MTPDNAPDSPFAGPAATGGTPKLADRLSALVGQAASRQEDTGSADRLVTAISARVDASTAELRERMTALESLVGDRLEAIATAVGASAGSDDSDVKAHVDEVGGALVLRLDEVLAGLAEQVEQTRAALIEQGEATGTTIASALDDARQQLAAQLDEARTHLAGHVDGVDATVRGHVGDLAAGVLELGGGAGLSREDLDASLTELRTEVRELPGLLDGVAQAAQLDGVTATASALRGQLDEVVVSLAAMRSEFGSLQAAVERRVDDAALALAETLVAVITSMPSARPAPAITYDLASDDAVPEGGLDGDWAAADSPEELEDLEERAEEAPVSVGDSYEQLDDAAVAEESQEQAAGIDEGGVESVDLADTELSLDGLESAFAQPAAPAAAPVRRKGIFRR